MSDAPSPAAPTHGTFTKDGQTRVAYDVAQAVSLRFDGWREEKPADLKGQALDDAVKAAGLPTTGTADEKRARLSTDKA